MDFWSQTLPWYVAGPAIALIMFLLTFMGHSFGISANLRTACAIMGLGKKVKFFDFDWKAQRWNLVFLGGALVGGFISSLAGGVTDHQISEATQSTLIAQGFHFEAKELLPQELSVEGFEVGKVLLLLLGGVLIGFGARYAGGCTSGHAISGLSNLQLPSLIAVMGFFMGGLAMSHFLLAPLVAFFVGGQP